MYYFNASLVVWGFAIILTVSAFDVYPETCTAVKPSSDGCGVFGGLRLHRMGSYAAAPQIVDSLEDCAALCAGRVASPELKQYPYRIGYYNHYSSYCESFSYRKSTNFCQLGTGNVTKVVKPNPKSHTVFYNADCFDCGQFCPQPYNTQLIANGGFEEQLLGPWTSYGGNLAKGHNSKHSYRCVYERGCHIDQEINLCTGKQYAFQFDYVIVTTNASIGVELDVGITTYPKEYNLALTSKNTDPLAWKTYRAYFVAGPNHSGPSFGIFRTSTPLGAQVFLDNVYISRVPSNPTIKQFGHSVIRNGNFESGELAPWKSKTHGRNKFQIVSPGINSQHGLLLNLSSSESAIPLLKQTLQTKPQTTYLLTFDMVTSQNAVYVTLYFVSQSEEYTSDFKLHKGNHSFSMLVYANHRTLLFKMQSDYYASEPLTIRLDNFKMVETSGSNLFS